MRFFRGLRDFVPSSQKGLKTVGPVTAVIRAATCSRCSSDRRSTPRLHQRALSRQVFLVPTDLFEDCVLANLVLNPMRSPVIAKS